MTALLACSSHVSDSALTQLLKDDRLPLWLERLLAGLREAVQFVQSLEDTTLAAVASTCSVGKAALRDQISTAALVQASFIVERVRAAKDPPWSLVTQDLDQALGALRAGPRPKSEFMGKLHDLLELGYERSALKGLLWLLHQASWSSTAVEQAHVASSALHRFHGAYEGDTLQARSLVAGFVVLVRPTKSSRKLVVLQRRMQRLERKRLEHFTGRQLYVRELMFRSADLRLRGRSLPTNSQSKVIQSHGKLWRAISREQRERYERKVVAIREKERDEISARRAALRATIKALEDDEAVRFRTGPLRLDDCRLSKAGQQELQDCFDHPQWTLAHVARSREAAVQRVGPPPQHVRDFLDSMPIRLPFVCRQREFTCTCVMKFVTEEVPLYLKVCFVRRSPFLVGFVRVFEATSVWPSCTPASSSTDAYCAWEHTFEVPEMDFTFSDGGELRGEWPVFFLPECTF